MATPEPEVPVTNDNLLQGSVKLTQPRHGYRVAIDPVLLAAAITAKPGERVLDAGLGVGAAALCLLHRIPEIAVMGVELQPALADLACQNAEANDRNESLSVITGHLDDPALSAQIGPVDQVMTNPPYHDRGRGQVSPNPSKDQAHREGDLDIQGWVKACRRFLKHKGRLTVIYPADRLDDLLAALHPHFGAVKILPLWPDDGGKKPARRLLVTARLGVKTPLELLPGLVLHQADGSYSEAAKKVVLEAGCIPLY